jgi:hypothetical protein
MTFHARLEAQESVSLPTRSGNTAPRATAAAEDATAGEACTNMVFPAYVCKWIALLQMSKSDAMARRTFSTLERR